MNKPNLTIHVQGATHFLSWELPYFRKYFNIVDTPDKNNILFVFGPDALVSGALLPAKLKVVLLFPGFGYNPYHNIIHRYGMQEVIDQYYDLVFVNPGPLHEAFRNCKKLRLCPFSINTDVIKLRRPRNKINNLIHISANTPQKDWTRSRDIMRLTGLSYEVFPSRNFPIYQRVLRRIRLYLNRKGYFKSNPLYFAGYDSHQKIIEKYHKYDGFVHIAAEIPPLVDGKYTATLLEAGLTGAILFWHDTLGLGNDFETIFNLSVDPLKAADEVLQIRQSIDIEAHSKKTAEEIYEHTNPEKIIRNRFEAIKELL